MDEKNQVIQPQADNKSEKKPKRVSTRIAAIIGFSLAGLAVLALICTVLIGFIDSNSRVTDAKLTSFKNDKQIVTMLKTVIKNSNSLYFSDANYIKGITDNSSPVSELGENAMDSEQVLNNHSAYTQFNSENEADTVKKDDKYIYFLSSGGGSQISIFSQEGESSKLVAKIAIDSDEAFIFRDFFISEGKLIAVEEEQVSVSADTSHAFTRVEIFDISDVNKIKTVDSFTQSGSYCSSRMADGILYLASSHHALDSKDLPRAAVSSDNENNPDQIAAENIYYVENPNEPNFMVISSFDTEGSEKALSAKAVLGSTDDVFFSESSLYVSAYEYNTDIFKKQNVDGASYIHLPVYNTQLVKFNLDNNLEATASAKIRGYIDNQYSLDEQDSKLRVTATTTLDNDKFTESASLFVLDNSLKCVGKLNDFASDKSVKAVRYIDDTAYVITYKDTDPLYVIDLKDSTSPKTLSEVKTSGLSSTLVPVDDNTLLSVGYYTADENSDDRDGVEIVTFDISNKKNPKKVDEKIFKNYESPVQYNSKALLINADKGEYTIPMIYENYNESDSRYETKYGILSFTVDNGKINVKNDYTSKIFEDSDESSVTLDRCVSSGDFIYLLGSAYNYYKAEGMALIEAVAY